MLIDAGFIFLSLALLYYGGDFLVTGSINLSKRFKVSPFFIGAVIIGFGTSAPEFAVSIMASLHGSGDLALANIVGSNITNVGLRKLRLLGTGSKTLNNGTLTTAPTESLSREVLHCDNMIRETIRTVRRAPTDHGTLRALSRLRVVI